MKESHFPFILLTAQEVHVYLVAMIALRHVLAHKHSTYAHYIHVTATSYSASTLPLHVYVGCTINICVWGWAIIGPRGHAGNNALIIA